MPLVTADSAAAEIAQKPVVSADAPPPPAPDDPVQKALEGQRRAEELQQRQAQEPMSVDRYVDSLPGLTDHKRQFLKAHPEMLNGQQFDLMAQAYGEAMRVGFQDDTPELDRFLVETVRAELTARHGRLAEAARSAMEPPRRPVLSVEQEVARLDAEVAAHTAIDHVNASTPAAFASQLPQPERMPRSRSMPMTAPVSRDTPMLSGQRPMSMGQVTLTAEERFIARNSFTDPNMTDADKEKLYATQKARLQHLRSQGLYPERERG